METPSAVAYDIVETPIGPLLLAATDRGLVQVAFELEDFDAVVESLASTFGVTVERDPDALADAAGQLAEYFAGERREFDLPLDRSLSSGFRVEVQRAMSEIPHGRTRTYKELADQVGNPEAVRAVGSACATNPIPIVVPCHRVLRSDGGLGGFRGGLEVKRTLLDLEGVT